MGRPATRLMSHRPRLQSDRLLGTRQTAGILVERHPDLVRRRCFVIACDVATHAGLYDLDEVAAAFQDTPRRNARLTD